jgi:transposase-like protein
MVQTCPRHGLSDQWRSHGSIHLVRHSLNFCSWKDRKAVAAKLREVYVAETAEAAWDALEAFDEDWGRQYPSIAQAWRRAWQEVIPFFAFSPEIRRVIYTTNAIESLNRIIRKAIKTRGSFPSEDAAEKLIYLAIRGHEKTARTVRGWLTAVNQFAIMFEDRFKPIQGGERSDGDRTGRPDTQTS